MQNILWKPIFSQRRSESRVDFGSLKSILLSLIDVDNAVEVSVALFPDCKEQIALLGLIHFSESEYL